MEERQRILKDIVDSVNDADRDTYFARSIPKVLVSEHGSGDNVEISSEMLKAAGTNVEFQIHFRDQPDLT
jgi:hypothetical protein